MTPALYARVSTRGQRHDSQLVELREYCIRRGWPEPREYTDTISGGKFTRAGLDRLMADVRKHSVQIVVCAKLDRLGRSLPHLAQLVGELSAHGVALVCTSQGIDTTDDNPAGRLQLHVLMAVAEFERSIIRERVNAGLRAAKQRGVVLGRRNSTDQHAEQARQMRAQGAKIAEIARILGISVGSVSRLLQMTIA